MNKIFFAILVIMFSLNAQANAQTNKTQKTEIKAYTKKNEKKNMTIKTKPEKTKIVEKQKN